MFITVDTPLVFLNTSSELVSCKINWHFYGSSNGNDVMFVVAKICVFVTRGNLMQFEL